VGGPEAENPETKSLGDFASGFTLQGIY